MKFLEVLAYITIVVVISFIVWTNCANAGDLPEYVDLTFNDQADLDARVDSVLGVCDTIRIDSSAAICAYGDTTIWFTYPRLLCRQFAGLTVYDNAHWEMTSGSAYFVIGHARLWWWAKQ